MTTGEGRADPHHQSVERVRAWVCACGNAPCDGLDCGVMLNPPRRKPAPKSADELASIRAKAWATRRARATLSAINPNKEADQ